MHKGKPNFNSLKFTPSIIANKIEIPIYELIEYFKSHTLKECAIRYKCSLATIKRKLKNVEYDTSIHNNSDLAKSKFIKTLKDKPSDEVVIDLYINSNLDTKTIAEMFNFHYNTIRNIVKRLRLKKSKKLISASMMSRHLARHGIRHPAQRHDVIKKTSLSCNKALYKGISFKSITELGYALYLDRNNIEWYYEEMRVPYVDMIKGTQRIYIIDFTIIKNDQVYWVEVKPNNTMIPEDKRIYASRRAEEAQIIYRGLDEDERKSIWDVINSGYNFNSVEFVYRTPRSSSTKITYYFKTEQEAIDYTMDGWKQFTKPTNNGALWKKILTRK